MIKKIWRCFFTRGKYFLLAKAADKIARHAWNENDMEMWRVMRDISDKAWDKVEH